MHTACARRPTGPARPSIPRRRPGPAGRGGARSGQAPPLLGGQIAISSAAWRCARSIGLHSRKGSATRHARSRGTHRAVPGQGGDRPLPGRGQRAHLPGELGADSAQLLCVPNGSGVLAEVNDMARPTQWRTPPATRTWKRPRRVQAPTSAKTSTGASSPLTGSEPSARTWTRPSTRRSVAAVSSVLPGCANCSMRAARCVVWPVLSTAR